MQDHGNTPYEFNIEQETLDNTNFRTTLWTGTHLQLTLMSIPVDGEIGLEVHPDHDQFIRVEQGSGRVLTGPDKDHLQTRTIQADEAILVPAGTWHNILNAGDVDLKLYSLYGPADHLPGTVHETKADADSDPNEH